MRANMAGTRLLPAVGAAVLLLAAGCGGANSSDPVAAPTGSSSPGAATSTPATTTPTTPTTPTTTTTASTAAAPTGSATGRYYLSLGDSYAAGYEPTGARSGHTTRNGFPYQVVTAARAKGFDYELVNLGCSGATTDSTLNDEGCDVDSLGPGAASYDDETQADAAEAFLQDHQGEVGLITVSLGGNDVIRCGVQADPLTCVTTAVTTVGDNLGTLLARLRAAAPDAQIVGTTYPDTLLAALLDDDASAQGIATLSVNAFRALINPSLEAAYEAVGGTFVDVTAASGAYGPLTRTVTLPPYGAVPVPVAKLCRLTYACEYQDFHPRPAGYALIARLVVGALRAG